MNLRDKANQATIAEAAEIVGAGVSTIAQAVQRGCIPHVMGLARVRAKYGGTRMMCVRLVDLADVEAYLAPRQTITSQVAELAHLDAPTVAARLGTTPNSVRTMRMRLRRRA